MVADTGRLGMRRVMQPSIVRLYIPLLLVLVFVEGGGAGAGGVGAEGEVGAGGGRARGSQGCRKLPWILSRSSTLAFSPLWLAAPPNFPRRRTAAHKQQQQQQQQQKRLLMQRRISMIPRTSPPCGTTRTRTIMKSGGGNMKGDGAPEGGGGSGGGGGGGGGGKVGGRSAKAPLSSSSSSPTSPSMSKQQMDDRGGTGNAGGDVSKVKSPVTGRLINVGGPSYVKLMELGYIRSGDEIVHRNVVSGDGVTPPPKYMERIDEPEELDALRGDIRQLWPGVGEVLERLGGEDVVYDKLRPVFDKLKEGDYVDLYTLRTVLITVNVSISAAKMLDLMDVATDAEGRVLLDYDAFEDLMLDILPSIDDGAPGTPYDFLPPGGASSSSSDSSSADDAQLAASMVEEGDAGDGSSLPLLADILQAYKEQQPASGNTESYLKRLSYSANAASQVKAHNFGLFDRYHTGDWKCVFTSYSVTKAKARKPGLFSRSEPVYELDEDDVISRLRVLSTLEPQSNGTCIEYVDSNLGDWVSGDDGDRTIPKDFGFFDQVRTCRSSNLQTVQIGESLMWSVRKGSVWTVEGSVVDGCGWKGRIVAVYEDVKSDTGAVRPELVRIVTVWGNCQEFPPCDLDGLKEECADDAYIGSLGQWYGIRMTREPQSLETCEETGADKHEMVGWNGHARIHGGHPSAGKNTIFLLPNGATLNAPEFLPLHADKAADDFVVGMTFMFGDGSVIDSNMYRASRLYNAEALLASSSSMAANKYKSQKLEKYWLYKKPVLDP